ncbi:MAG TPA: SDR family NAD(P)-dependent oxidoreductase [Vicinamibacterales bacterium]|nr:SDR family NAD(P)-dependent oxidoreductase [Vicinamibacterales bacterium]
MTGTPEPAAEAVAIIGMAGRFPRARNVDEFWRNLRDGVLCTTTLRDDELIAAGVDPALARHPRYVKVKGLIDDVEMFDAGLFGYTPSEAQAMDPQQRLFLECGWAALENAGYLGGSFDGSIGVFAGSSLNTYLLSNLASHPQMLQFAGADKDYLATRLSYKLNLRGPSVSVQTACSTSLVAVCQAAQALLTYQCDIALAGGVSVVVPVRTGYFSAEGSILAPDGRCRAFDADARGTVPGQGIGIVVLKRLSEALADGDDIAAVIRGFAVNNDGSAKMGYTAPGVEGQAQVIALAQALAGIDADTIGYVETHGTGTELGDPIEIAALTQAFRAGTTRRGYCAIGSLKPSVGHLDAAAGVASLIKAALAVRDGVLPPSLNYRAPNPAIDFDSTPFFVNTSLAPWPAGPSPRRAGVSSFGIGGTNAHVVLEEAPRAAASSAGRQWQTLLLSARSAAALETLSLRLADHLAANPGVDLADVAFTLHGGRRRLPHRRAVVCRTIDEAVAGLSGDAGARVHGAVAPDGAASVAITISGAGRPDAASMQQLYEREHAVRDAVDACRRTWTSELGQPGESDAFTLFAAQYAAGMLWLSLGVPPLAIVGEGVGHLAAQCLAGRMTLADALRGVAAGAETPSSCETQRADLAARGSAFLEIEPGTLSPEGVAQGIATLWLNGIEIDSRAYYAGERRRRVPLPEYPFERQRFWLDPRPAAAAAPQTRRSVAGVDEWFYQPVWRRSILPDAPSRAGSGVTLVFADAHLGPAIAAALNGPAGGRAVIVRPDAGFRRMEDGSFGIDPASARDYVRLASELAADGLLPSRIVHLWSLETPVENHSPASARRTRDLTFYSLLYLAQALARERGFDASRVTAFTSGAQGIGVERPAGLAQAAIAGICRVLPQEYPGLRSRTIDLSPADLPGLAADPALLLREIDSDAADVAVAYRAGVRWTQSFEPLRLAAGRHASLRDRGVYLITGGLGNIGLTIAEHFARTAGARLVLTARHPLPPREEWPARAAGDASDPIVRRIRAVEALEAAGAEVLVSDADVADAAAMRRLLAEIDARFGALNGVVHAAGALGGDGFRPIRDLDVATCERHFLPKVDGVLTLESVLAGRALDFCVLMSSLSAQLGGVGYAAYAAANACLDAFAAGDRGPGRWISVSWDGWHMGPATAGRPGVTPSDGIDALMRVLAADGLDHVVVSAGDLQERIAQWVTLNDVHAQASAPADVPRHPRPALRNEYVAPATDLERRIAAVWRDMLGIEPIGSTDNFFELGGDSLRGLQVTARLNKELSTELSPVSLYEAPTVAALASFIQDEGGRKQAAQPGRERGERRRAAVAPRPVEPAEGRKESSRMSLIPSPDRSARGFAIVGMAGRFPGAADIDTFWQNLKAGVESRTILTDEDLLATGYSPAALQNKKLVRSAFILDDIEHFDSGFFGINPREADLLDPQHRLFLECAWQAMEHAGYDPETFPGSVGVFGGATLGSYLNATILRNPELVKSVGMRAAIFGSVPDYMVTRVAYKLNLRGPAVFIQSACSTSLVAVHMGCQSLANHECDMVLAGGVSAPVPQRSGYVYEEGSMMSPDGICRTFDANARGTVFGSGVGLVVVKRLEDAIADGDTIHAVIKGAAANNDGSLKVGFTAPGVVGQARVVAEALGAAGVAPDTVSYIEAHGTGTELGDPIEIAALTRAYGGDSRRHAVAIGSVKPNIGHLDAAAGVSSLIKTIMALKHKQLPQTINFERPNPKIDFDNSPFYVNTTLQPWTAGEGAPRRAGVSSFGFGGTNAHVILEEAPAAETSAPSRSHQLLVLSARTPTALESATARLADELQRQPLSIADAAYTLAVGRRPFAQRRAVVCGERGEAVELMQTGDPRRVSTAAVSAKDRPVVFMFPGQGAQHVDMARGIYEQEPLFRELVDECADLLLPELGVDIREVIFGGNGEADADRLKHTSLTQPALFVIEYALSRLWISWGIKPAAMIGHSIGELVAACLSGVFTLESALKLVAVRGRLMEAMPPGTMAAVPLPADRVSASLGPDLWLAAVNAPSLCVVSGQPQAVDRFIEARSREGIDCRRLHTSHAFHSGLMEAAVAAFTDAVRAAEPATPAVPFISNITGTWITDAQATDPAYWGKHILQPVRFSEGIAELLNDQTRVMLEVGPGTTLSGLVRQQSRGGAPLVVASLRHPNDPTPDVVTLLTALGRLWCEGSTVDWAEFYGRERRRRVPLPTYPFERQRHWVDPEPFSRRKSIERIGSMMSQDLTDWFHVVSWKRSVAPTPAIDAPTTAGPCLLFADDSPVQARLAARLSAGRRVVTVRPGSRVERIAPDTYTVSPDRAGYAALLKELRDGGAPPSVVVHAWNLTGRAEPDPDDARAAEQQQRGFYSLLYLAQAYGELGVTTPVRLAVLTDGIHEVTGGEAIVPEKATVIGPCRVVPMEFTNVSCTHIDLDASESAGLSDGALDVLLADALRTTRDFSVAYRRGRRYMQGYEGARLEAVPEGPAPRLRERGVYLITGGFGGIGLVLAEHLAATLQARLVLTARKALPPRDQWGSYVAQAPAGDALRKRIEAVQQLERLGAEVLVGEADAADEAKMRAVVEAAKARFGRIDGVVHSAGIAGGGVIQLKKPEVAADVIAPKLYGARILSRIFAREPLDFMVYCSSLTAVVGGVGQVDYCGANACLDAFARQFAAETGTFSVAINWNAWQEVGMAVDTNVPADLRESLKGAMLAGGISNKDGIDAFRRILARSSERQVAIMPNDLGLLFQAATLPAETRPRVAAAASADAPAAAPQKSSGGSRHPRPALQTPYLAPRTPAEEKICAVWEDLLGIERVGVNDNFFELGGHSLLAITVMGRINAVLQSDMPVARLYDGLTVAFLAGVAGGGGAAHSAPAVEEGDPEDDERRRDRARRQREQQARRRGAMRETSRT